MLSAAIEADKKKAEDAAVAAAATDGNANGGAAAAEGAGAVASPRARRYSERNIWSKTPVLHPATATPARAYTNEGGSRMMQKLFTYSSDIAASFPEEFQVGKLTAIQDLPKSLTLTSFDVMPRVLNKGCACIRDPKPGREPSIGVGVQQVTKTFVAYCSTCQETLRFRLSPQEKFLAQSAFAYGERYSKIYHADKARGMSTMMSA